MSWMPLSFRFCGSVPASSPACSLISSCACPGVRLARKNWLIVARLIGQGVDLALVHAVDLVDVVRERREAVHVLPHAVVGRVEEVGTVAVHLDAGLLFLFAVGVAADVVAAVDDDYLQAQLSGGLFCDCQAEKARPYDDEVSGHKLSWFECGQRNVVHCLLV